MAFELAKIAIVPASIGTGIKASLKKVRDAPAKLSITITGQTLKDFGWSDGDKIVVQIGTKEHHGLLRLQRNNSTGQAVFMVRKAVKGGSYGALQLGHQNVFVDRSEEALWCQWEKVEGGAIEIVLPKWADETRPVRDRRVPATTPALTPLPRKSQNVTSALMGDPEPGRSALENRSR